MGSAGVNGSFLHIVIKKYIRSLKYVYIDCFSILQALCEEVDLKFMWMYFSLKEKQLRDAACSQKACNAKLWRWLTSPGRGGCPELVSHLLRQSMKQSAVPLAAPPLTRINFDGRSPQLDGQILTKNDKSEQIHVRNVQGRDFLNKKQTLRERSTASPRACNK
jgi:hypothetical protein